MPFAPRHVRAPGSARRNGGYAANIAGDHLEKVVISSQSDALGRVVRLIAWPRSGARFLSGGKAIALPIAFDFSGTAEAVLPRAHVCFDAKSVGQEGYGLDLANEKVVKLHQITHLVRQAEAGAVAGLLVESKMHRDYRWLRAAHLMPRRFIPWHDPSWLILGTTDHPIPIRKLLETYLP